MSTVTSLGQRTQLVTCDDGAAASCEAAHQPAEPCGPSESHCAVTGNVAGRNPQEAIDWVNDPTRFGVSLETRIDRLKDKGSAAQRPWADTYWPTYQDAINHRWQSTGNFLNDLSPAEKFDVVFSDWDPQRVAGKQPFKAEWGSYDKPGDDAYYANLGPFAKYVSDFRGNKQTRDAAKAGLLNADGTAKNGNEKDDYGGIQTWWGLCHAWAPASIREQEPLHAVTMDTPHGQIRFEVSDIKALAIACYNRSNSVMIGGRNEDRPSEIELDERGRPKKQDMRDINPGTMHILLANMLGRDGKSFVEDRTGHYEVWNQPIAEYRVTQQDEVTKEQALALVRDTDGTYDYNPRAERFFHVKTEVDYITESHPSTRPNAGGDGQERTDPYEYILECDSAGKIIGGEWLGNSRKEHPDFLWVPTADGGGTLAPQISLAQVRELIQKSREPEGGGGGTGGANASFDVTLRAGEAKTLEPIRVERDGVLEFTQTGDGDIDVYVKKNGVPTFNPANGTPLVTDMFLYESGSNERKTLNVKAGDVVNVVARGYDPQSFCKLVVKQIQ